MDLLIGGIMRKWEIRSQLVHILQKVTEEEHVPIDPKEVCGSRDSDPF